MRLATLACWLLLVVHAPCFAQGVLITDLDAAIMSLKHMVGAVPNVSKDPGVEVEILEFNLVGPVLAVRPHTHNDHYWQVYFDTNRAIRAATAGFPAPTPSQIVTVHNPS